MSNHRLFFLVFSRSIPKMHGIKLKQPFSESTSEHLFYSKDLCDRFPLFFQPDKPITRCPLFIRRASLQGKQEKSNFLVGPFLFLVIFPPFPFWYFFSYILFGQLLVKPNFYRTISFTAPVIPVT